MTWFLLLGAVARVPFLNDLWTWTKLGAAVGSCLFCFSDLLVATKTFCGDFPFSQFLIMTTYYAVSHRDYNSIN